MSLIYRLFVNTGNVTSIKVFGRLKGTTTLYDHEELVICEMLTYDTPKGHRVQDRKYSRY